MAHSSFSVFPIRVTAFLEHIQRTLTGCAQSNGLQRAFSAHACQAAAMTEIVMAAKKHAEAATTKPCQIAMAYFIVSEA